MFKCFYPGRYYDSAYDIEYGEFFRKMDSIFFLIWIISFVSYLSLTLKFSANIFKKLTYSKSNFFFIFISAFLLFITSGLVFVIAILVLLLAFIKKKIKRWSKWRKNL